MSAQRLRYWAKRLAEDKTHAAPTAAFVVVSNESFDKTAVTQHGRQKSGAVIEILVNDAYVVRVPYDTVNWKDILQAMREIEK
jgi:hypothetical protein